MLNQGNLIPPAGGKDVRKFVPADKDAGKYVSSGVPNTDAMGDDGLSLIGDPRQPFQLNVRPIADGVGPKPDPRKGTLLPESDDALEQFAAIEAAQLSQGVFEHEQNVEVPQEGFNDPANLKV
jgi:hypothetical protein